MVFQSKLGRNMVKNIKATAINKLAPQRRSVKVSRMFSHLQIILLLVIGRIREIFCATSLEIELSLRGMYI